MKKILYIFCTILMVFCFTANVCLAADGLEDAIISGMKDVNQEPGGMDTSSGIGKVINMVIGIFQIVGTGLSLIMASVYGIRYMIAGASEKADVKKQAVPILIGCVLLFSAVNIAAVIEKIANSTLNS